MKKLIVLLSSIATFVSPSAVLAASPTASPIIITPPTKGYANIGEFVTNVFTLSFGLALLVVMVMLIWGAFEWITSGGDKEAVGHARGRIINALIGLAILAVAFALARVGADFIGIDITKIDIPSPK